MNSTKKVVVTKNADGTLEEIYNIESNKVPLTRKATKSGKTLEFFSSPLPEEGNSTFTSVIHLPFPEFTCKCPRTGHPDFANINIEYSPKSTCVELKSLKYYLNSFRDEGHFHEEVISMMFEDLWETLEPSYLKITGKFNTRGGISPEVTIYNRTW